jgi:hypothetical protein
MMIGIPADTRIGTMLPPGAPAQKRGKTTMSNGLTA